ncbi:MAG: hypothetical protein Q9M89_03070 [Persephonella sp.]|nr:hypothetical protein [Persephonella sp.]
MIKAEGYLRRILRVKGIPAERKDSLIFLPEVEENFKKQILGRCCGKLRGYY